MAPSSETLGHHPKPCSKYFRSPHSLVGSFRPTLMTNYLLSLLGACVSSALTFRSFIYGAQVQLLSTAVVHDKSFRRVSNLLSR